MVIVNKKAGKKKKNTHIYQNVASETSGQKEILINASGKTVSLIKTYIFN